MKVYWIGWMILIVGAVLQGAGRGDTRWWIRLAGSLLLCFGLGMLLASAMIGWGHWPAA